MWKGNSIKVLNENISNFNIKNKTKVLHLDYNKALKHREETTSYARDFNELKDSA